MGRLSTDQVITLCSRVCIHNKSGQALHLLLAVPRAPPAPSSSSSGQQHYRGPAPFFSEETVLQPDEVK